MPTHVLRPRRAPGPQRIETIIAAAAVVLIAAWLATAPRAAASAATDGTTPAAPVTAAPSAGPPREAGPFLQPDLVEIVSLDPTIRLDIHYARADNFTGKPVCPEARAFLQRPAALALLKAHRALAARGYGLTIFDAYRPWSVTRRFWELTPADKKVFVADPAKGSKHNRGCAVDLTLHDLKTGKEVAMPSPYDDFTDKAYATYTGGDPQARERCSLLREAMEEAGFFVYPNEWWHFDYKDWRDYPILDVPFDAIHPAAAPAPSARIDPSHARLVDLTWTFDDSTLYWPTSPSAFDLKPLANGPTPAGYFYAANSFCAPEHGGTHLDAPIHFSAHGATADRIPLERLLAPGIVIDATAQAALDADFRLGASDVRAWESRHGTIAPGTIVLLRTGWDRRWPDRLNVFGDATPHDASHLHFPGYGEDAAALLVERQVAAIGIDTPSIDYGPSLDFRAHVAFLGAGVPAFENVARLEELPETGAFIAALPMKIGGGSGGPLRIVAMLPAEPAASARAQGGAR
jgi:D-alanyl-D-alanine dipeptidase/kynurenine formamidase